MDYQFIRNLVIKHEGWRTRCYFDSLGYPTIGVGLNLASAGVAVDLAAVNAPPLMLLRTGQATLTNLQVGTLLDIRLKRAIQAATLAAPDYNTLPGSVQAVLADMQYALGAPRAAKFKLFWAAVHAHNWPEAARQLVHSDWYMQANNRVTELIGMLRDTAISPPTKEITNAIA
jgi:GH24 family phage-related lysozyme (muramidase)